MDHKERACITFKTSCRPADNGARQGRNTVGSERTVAWGIGVERGQLVTDKTARNEPEQFWKGGANTRKLTHSVKVQQSAVHNPCSNRRLSTTPEPVAVAAGHTNAADVAAAQPAPALGADVCAQHACG